MKPLMSRLQEAVLEAVAEHAREGGSIPAPTDFAYHLIAVACVFAEKGKTPVPRVLASFMVITCRENPDLAHAALDDAFDMARRAKRTRGES